MGPMIEKFVAECPKCGKRGLIYQVIIHPEKGVKATYYICMNCENTNFSLEQIEKFEKALKHQRILTQLMPESYEEYEN